MAATAIAGVSHYIGTAAERAALSTTGLPAGSTFYETDTPALYIYGGAAWTEHIATVKTGSNVATVGGSAAHDAAASGNPVQVGGVYRSADPAVADGDAVSLRVNAKGEPLVQLTGSNAGARETLTIDATVGGVGMTGATISGYTKALVTCESAQVRFTIDGTAPTTAIGHLLNPGDVLELDTAADMTAFRAIRTGATSGSLQCTYSV